MKVLRIFFFLIYLVGCVEAKEQKNMSEYEIVSFNTTTKSLEVKKLKNNELIQSLPLSNLDLINPFLLSSESANGVSVIEYSPNGEVFVDLETGGIHRSPQRYGTYVFNENLVFYFESRKGKVDVLIAERDGVKKVVHTFKKSSVSRPRSSVDGVISWFFRREHTLFVYEQDGNVSLFELPSCRDAIWLGGNEGILCLNEKKGLSKVFAGKAITVLNNDLTFRVVSSNTKAGEIYLSSISTSLSLDSFLTEFHDIYVLDLNTNEIRLLKEKAIRHGINYFVRKLN